MSGFVRIRLNFQRSLSFPEIKNCWFLVDTSTCSTIADLEYLIKKRFGVLSTNSALIDLFLDDYLLPSQEKIEIIQHNDNIRVEMKKVVTKKSSEESESNHDSQKEVKRKQRKANLPDASIKSGKRSSDKSSLPSSSSTVTASKSTKTPQRNSHKSTKAEQKPGIAAQKLLLTANSGKRKCTEELSKLNAKKSKTNSGVNHKDSVTLQNGFHSDSSSSESYSSTESTSQHPHNRKLNTENLKTLVETRKATIKGTAKHGLKVALSSSESSRSLSEFTSKTKHNIGNFKTDAEKRKATLRQTTQNRGKNALKSDSSSSESSSSTESSSEHITKMKHNIGNFKANAEKGKVTTRGIGKNGGKNLESDSSSSESFSSSASSESCDEKIPSKILYSKVFALQNGLKSSVPEASKHQSGNSKSPCHKGPGKDVQKQFSAVGASTVAKGMGAKPAKRGTIKPSTVLQGQQKGNCAVSSSSSDSNDSEELVNVAMIGSTQENQPSLSLSSMSSPLPRAKASSQMVNTKAGDIHNETAQVEKRKYSKVKNVASSSASSLLPTMPASSNSFHENKTRDTCITAGQMTKTSNTVSSMHLPLPSFSTPSVSTCSSSYNNTQDCNNRASPSALPSKTTGQSNSRQRARGQGNDKLVSGSCLSTTHIRFDSEDEDAEAQDGGSVNSGSDYHEKTRPYAIAADGKFKPTDQTVSSKTVEQKEPTQRDYTACPPLHGPPRVGDKIAYKVLELSASYTPEISNYKEGTVISYEASTGEVNVELTKESLKKTQGDGNITGKFELVYEEDEENQYNSNNGEQLETRVVVHWSSMLEPVLIEG